MISIQNKEYPEGTTAYNAIGEIPGTDKRDEIVILGGHYDSWHDATGATDNGTGSSMMLEAARILASLHVRSEEHTSELQSQSNLVCRLLLEKKNNTRHPLCTVPVVTVIHASADPYPLPSCLYQANTHPSPCPPTRSPHRRILPRRGAHAVNA